MTSGTLLKITSVWVISCPARRAIINWIHTPSETKAPEDFSSVCCENQESVFSKALICFVFITLSHLFAVLIVKSVPRALRGTRTSVMMKVKKRARMRAKPPGPTLLLQRGVQPNVTFISAEAAVGMQPPKASPAFWQAASLASGGATDAFIMWEVQNVAPDKNEDSGVIGQNICFQWALLWTTLGMNSWFSFSCIYGKGITCV